jgi:protein SCO1/2
MHAVAPDAGTRPLAGGRTPTTVGLMRSALSLVAALTILIGCGLASACGSDGRTYPLEGQVLAVDRDSRTLTVKHGDIVGFMPGMTMAFPVDDVSILSRVSRGDLVRATLVVDDTHVALSAVEVTGHAEPPPAAALPGTYDILEPGEAVPDVAFVDQAGATTHLSDWRGQPVAVTFVYTRCPLPDFCPAIDRRFAEVQAALAAQAAGGVRAHLVSVTIDPQFDTPAVLAAHAEGLRADPAIWTFVTGDAGALDAFARRFGVSVMRDTGDAAGIVHNLRTAVIDGEGHLATILNGREWTPADLVSELERAPAR